MPQTYRPVGYLSVGKATLTYASVGSMYARACARARACAHACGRVCISGQ
jgi:hypothetical protein